MSTHAAILTKTDTGYSGIYLHFDGYPSHALKTLESFYNTQDKVDELIALGDLSYLAERVKPDAGERHSFSKPLVDVTLAYRRDRGECKVDARKGSTAKEVLGGIDYDYAYLFENGNWKQIT